MFCKSPLFYVMIPPSSTKSDQSLYQETFATFEEDQVYDQGDATGFVRLTGVRLKINALQGRCNK